MRDIRSISIDDWVVYLAVSLLLLVGIFAIAETRMEVDGWLLIIALSALSTFGIVVESRWQYRRHLKFWLILAGLLSTHFVVLLRVHPKLSFLWFAPLSWLELIIAGSVLSLFDFPLILKPKPREMPVGPYRSLFIKGTISVVSSTVLILLAWLFRFRFHAGASAALVYVFFLIGLAGTGIVVVGLGRWTMSRLRSELLKNSER